MRIHGSWRCTVLMGMVGIIGLGAFSSCGLIGPAKRKNEARRRISSLEFPPAPPSQGALDFLKVADGLGDTSKRHIHLMHIDGVHPEVFKNLLYHQQLPHFSFLLSRGKISYSAATVDKTETMKVIQSYLTSRTDTEVVGWWQFQREDFRFYNTWMDPAGVIDYALGMQYPRFPTLFDFLGMKGERVTSGFGLHRRGVAFKDYSRNYKEGLQGAFQHTYFHQAHQTMGSLLNLYKKTAEEKRLPKLTHSLLAPADEWAHLKGMTTDKIPLPARGNSVEYCIDRHEGKEAPLREALFEILENDLSSKSKGSEGVVFVDKGFKDGRILNQKGSGHFYNLKKSIWGRLYHFCIRLPVMEFHSDPWPDEFEGAEELELNALVPQRKVLHPNYVLGLILVDIELGRLLNTLRGIKWPCRQEDRESCLAESDAWPRGIEELLKKRRPEHSLFEETLFVFTGDHGMTDTKAQMMNCRNEQNVTCEEEQSPLSLNKSFIEYLNENLGLTTMRANEGTPHGTFIGVDDTLVPAELSAPHKVASWQDQQTKKWVQDAGKWGEEFYGEIHQLLKSELSQKYWWLFFLKEIFVFPKLEGGLGAVKDKAKDLLTGIYLRGIPQYVAKERQFLRSFYNRHVRLVYGGGARNNAEIFLPHQTLEGVDWGVRPAYEEILNYRIKRQNGGSRGGGDGEGEGEGKLVLDVLKENPGVGLIFIRQNNHLFRKGTPLPSSSRILVMDRWGRKGEISVERDQNSQELVYGYRSLTERDPLGIFSPEWVHGTYSEWNHRGVAENLYYPNVVAGIGQYLHSNNDAIGDIFITHAQGWCFGDNLGGHGGVHRDEKLTMMMVSGPGLAYGELMSEYPWQTEQQTETEEKNWAVKRLSSPRLVHPTVLDIATGILDYLGHGKGQLTRLGRSPEFRQYWEKWNQKQLDDILNNLDDIQNLKDALAEMGLQNIKISKLKERFKRFFQFMPREIPAPTSDPQELQSREEGHVFNLE